MTITAHRVRRTAAVLIGAVLTSLTLAAAPGPALGAPVPPDEADGPTATLTLPAPTGRYLSRPPTPAPAGRAAPRPTAAHAPSPAPTKGRVTGRVLTPAGKPFAGALVQGVRFDDLGPGLDFDQEKPVLARTDAQGRFRLPQLTERYLLKICDAAPGAKECSGADRYAPTYVGPDGVRDSWVTQTRMFTPKQPARAVAAFRMKRYAQLTGVVRGVQPGSWVHLVRGNGTEAHRVRVDRKGRYRLTVVPGRYRVEVDRHEGLRSVSTVPGFRSRWLTLTAAKPTTLSFGTTPAATVTGVLTINGQPVVERLIAITDARGRWAAGTVTDQAGRYRVESLKPGAYRVQTLHGSAAELPVGRAVTLALGTVVRADLETSTGGSVRFSTTDGDRTGEVDLEIRDADSRLVKGGVLEAGQRVRVSGLPPGTYHLVVRRAHDGLPTTQDSFPWAQRTFTVTGAGLVDLGPVALDQPTLRLSGTAPKGSQVKIVSVPSDVVLRPQYVTGPSVTPMSQPWTEKADAQGRYVSQGLVPGRYAVSVSTALRESQDGPSATGGNIAVTHSHLVVGDVSRTADLTAPAGGILTGRLRYAGTTRAPIAPIGFVARDGGAQSTLFPTVSGPQRFGRGFRVDRLHAGPVTAGLLDSESLNVQADAESIRIPDSLVQSAPIAERRTPYWLSADPTSVSVAAGKVTTLAPVDITIRR